MSDLKKKLLGWSFIIISLALAYLLYTCISLSTDRKDAEEEWTKQLEASPVPPADHIERADGAVEVYASTYINTIDALDIKQSEFSITFDVLFGWDKGKYPDFDMTDKFQIYNGSIKDIEKVEEYDRDTTRYQMFQISADVKEVFSTKRFPLSSYQMRFYLQPKENMNKIHMRTMDKKYGGTNRQLNVSGFELLRTDMADYYYEVPNPERFEDYSDGGTAVVYSEVLTCIELNRSSWGVYFKCTIALIGITIWVFLCLLVCIDQKKDTMTLIPPVMFGMVSNIMVGANLVPDALETGLLEYINIWGIYTVIIITLVIISINKMRNKKEDERNIRLFGLIISAEIFITTTIGYILIPVSAYRW